MTTLQQFSRTLSGALIVGLSLVWLSFTYAQPCSITPNDGWPYAINEGDDLIFNANSSFGGPGPLSMGWDFGGAFFLGNWTGLMVPWNNVQNGLLTAFGGDSWPNSYPGGIEYMINDGGCTITGSTDLMINNTDPNASFLFACPSDLSGIVLVDFLADDPAQDDYPLWVFLIADDGFSQTVVDTTTVAGPVNTGGTLNFDTTSLPDAPYTLFLEVQDDVGMGIDSILCTVDNGTGMVMTWATQSTGGGSSWAWPTSKKTLGDDCPDGDTSGSSTDGICKYEYDSNPCINKPSLSCEDRDDETCETIIERCDTYDGIHKPSADDEDEYIEICFDFVYPIILVLADGTKVQVNSLDEYNQVIDQDITEVGIALYYPVQIELEDGTTETINNNEELVPYIYDCEESPTDFIPPDPDDLGVDTPEPYDDDLGSKDSSDEVLDAVFDGADLADLMLLRMGVSTGEKDKTPVEDAHDALNLCDGINTDSSWRQKKRYKAWDSSNPLLDFLAWFCPEGEADQELLEILLWVLMDKTPQEQQDLIQRALRNIDNIPRHVRQRIGVDQQFFTITLLRLADTQHPNTALMEKTDKVLKDIAEHLASSADGTCPPELLAQLLETKGQLEAEAAILSASIKKKEVDLAALKKKIDDQKEAIKKKEKDLADQKKKADDKQKDIDKLDKDAKDLDKDIKDLQDKVQDLQDVLTNEDDITEHVGDAPLEDIQSGAAVSFDGGASRVVAHGESWVEKLTGKFDGLRSVIDKLQEHEKDIRDKKKEKKQKEEDKKKAEDEKAEMDKKIKDCEDKLKDMKKKLAEDEEYYKKCEDELNKLKAQAQELNDKIDAFNAAAEECGVEAEKAYEGARKKLDQMPPDDKEEAEEEFEEDLTEDEEDAINDPSDDKSTGGSGLGWAAEKLEEAMRNASDCPPPQEKTHGPIRDGQNSHTLKWVEGITIGNSQGSRGLTDESQREILEQLSIGIKIIDTLSTVISLADFASTKNPFAAIFSLWFQSSAIDAILDKLSERQRNGKLKGLPEWIEFSYGRLRDVTFVVTDMHTDTYECVDGIWQYKSTSYTQEIDQWACQYSDGDTYRYTVDDKKLNFEGCSLGSCPHAWTDATKLGLSELMKIKLKDRVIGRCE